MPSVSRPSEPWPARSCSSVNSRTLASDIFGPSIGPLNFFFWAWRRKTNKHAEKEQQKVDALTLRPNAKTHWVTWGILCFSKRSIVWKSSASPRPYARAAFSNQMMETDRWRIDGPKDHSRNSEIFSRNLNAPPDVAYFGTAFGWSWFINLVFNRYHRRERGRWRRTCIR